MAHTTTVTVEIRPGEGGEDAAVFADELVAVVTRIAARAGLEPVTQGADRTRATAVTVTGAHATRAGLAQLAGTHRIQRVPANDKRGRRQTSTATVTVLTGTDAPPVTIDPADVIEDTHRGTGKGGQHQNTTDSAVRLRHVPSGVVVSVQGRKQHANRTQAWAELQRRLAQLAIDERAAAVNGIRHSQVSAPDRSAKGWTWCVYRDEVVDHDTGRRWRYRDVSRGRMELR